MDSKHTYAYFQMQIAELEVIERALVEDNSRWRGQQHDGGQIDLNSLEEKAWNTYFRFSKDEIYHLANCLYIPDKV